MRLAVRWLLVGGVLALLAPVCGVPAAAAPGDIVGPALVRSDGTLRIGQRWIRLYGVHIPDTGRQCRTRVLPAYCGNPAAVALDTRIQSFVVCRPVGRSRDGSLHAFCAVEHSVHSPGEDLGSYLIARGLALALPRAPFAYVALERIAQARGLGLWGFSVGSLTRP